MRNNVMSVFVQEIFLWENNTHKAKPFLRSIDPRHSRASRLSFRLASRAARWKVFRIFFLAWYDTEYDLFAYARRPLENVLLEMA